jgi:hypothetical protein
MAEEDRGKKVRQTALAVLQLWGLSATKRRWHFWKDSIEAIEREGKERMIWTCCVKCRLDKKTKLVYHMTRFV